MVLKRFVKGIDQEAFFQKRVPENHPDFIDTATLHYARGTSAEEAVIRDAAGLAWVVNLGCLDLNPHPVRAEDLDHPDELRVDLDPMPGRRLVADRRRRDGRAGGARRRRARRAGRRRAARAASTSSCGSRRSGTSSRCGSPPRPSPARSRTARPDSRPRAGGRRSAARACSSTSTRTRRTAPSRPRTRSGRCPTRGCRRRWTGTRCGVRRPEEFTVRDDARALRRDRRPARGHRRRRRHPRRPAARSPKELGPAEKPPRGGGSGDGRRQSTMPLIEVARTKTKPEAMEALEAVEGAASRRRRAAASRRRRSSTACAARARSGTACASTCSTCPRPSVRQQEELIADYDPWAGKVWPGATPDPRR